MRSASHACHWASGRSCHSVAAASTKLGWRTTISANAPSGAPRPSSQASQANAGARSRSSAAVMQGVGLLGVAVADPVPRGRGQRRLQLHDALREPRGVGEADQLGEALEVGDVGRADLGVGLLAVVRLVRQPEAGLVQVHEVAARVLRVGGDERADQRRAALALAAAEHAGERGVVGRCGDLVEQRAQRLDPERFHPLDVHERGVEGGDAPRVVVGLLGRALDDGAHVGLGAVAEHDEGAVLRAVVGDLVGGQPAAVDVGEQVVLRADAGVDPREVDAGAGRVRRERHRSILPGAVGGYRFHRTAPRSAAAVLACAS